jgi:SanA protein
VWAFVLPLIPALLIALCMRIEVSAAKGRVYKTMSEMPNYRVALVLGAGIKPNGALSWPLRHRLNKAIELYNSGRVGRLLMSGDNQIDSYNEPEAMARYAVSQGVPARDITCDFAGRRTWDSVYRAKNIFDIDKVVIVTQAFHMPRALFLAGEVGLDAYGVEAPPDQGRRAQYREYPASVSAVLDAWVLRPTPVMGKHEELKQNYELE